MHPVAEFITQSRYKTVKELVVWLQKHCRKGEYVDVHCWHEEFWYIEVIDGPMSLTLTGHEKPRAMRIGFTVNIATDTIRWNYLCGNCWVRDRYWFERFGEEFPVHARNSKTKTRYISVYKFSPRRRNKAKKVG